MLPIAVEVQGSSLVERGREAQFADPEFPLLVRQRLKETVCQGPDHLFVRQPDESDGRGVGPVVLVAEVIDDVGTEGEVERKVAFLAIGTRFLGVPRPGSSWLSPFSRKRSITRLRA